MTVIKTVKNFAKKTLALAGILGLALSVLLPSISAQASGPHFATEKELFRGMNLESKQDDWMDPVSGRAGDSFSGLVYIHNNEPDTVADNTIVKIVIPPHTVNKSAVLSATVSAQNANTLSDTLTVNLNEDAGVQYIPGSAKLFKVVDEKPVQIPFPHGNGDNVVAGGVKIGDIRGCFEFVHFVSVNFKTIKKEEPKNPRLHISKLVKNVTKGETSFVESNEAVVNDILEYKVDFSNTGDAPAHNVRLRDTIPAGTSFISGSAVMSINGGAEQTISDEYVGDGIILPVLNPRDCGVIRFRVKINSDCAEGTLVNTAFINDLSDTATTILRKVVTPPVVIKKIEEKVIVEKQPLPVSGPLTYLSIMLASAGVLFMAFRKHQKKLKSVEAQIIRELVK